MSVFPTVTCEFADTHIEEGGWKDICERISANTYILVWVERRKWKWWTVFGKLYRVPQGARLHEASLTGLIPSGLPLGFWAMILLSPKGYTVVVFSPGQRPGPPVPSLQEGRRVASFGSVVLSSHWHEPLLLIFKWLKAAVCSHVLENKGKVSVRISFYTSYTHHSAPISLVRTSLHDCAQP